ncbi:hypothetical protein VCHENC02_1713B, partial [Vibrio harveyi]
CLIAFIVASLINCSRWTCWCASNSVEESSLSSEIFAAV